MNLNDKILCDGKKHPNPEPCGKIFDSKSSLGGHLGGLHKGNKRKEQYAAKYTEHFEFKHIPNMLTNALLQIRQEQKELREKELEIRKLLYQMSSNKNNGRDIDENIMVESE